jgi:DNA-binding NarL/FixJ family response regulator
VIGCKRGWGSLGNDKEFKSTDAMEEISFAIADDHTLLRRALIQMLTSGKKPMKLVAEAGNGKEMIEKLDPLTLPQIIFLDTNMPVMNGIECCAYLSRQYPDIKIVCMLMEEDEQLVIALLRNGAHGLLSKADDPAEIMDVVKRILEGKERLPVISSSFFYRNNPFRY